MARLSGIQIISLVGQQGAGKSVTGDLLADYYGAFRVEASSVVKELCGDLPRNDMPSTNKRTATEPTWLGDAISLKIVSNSDSSIAVLTGVRETEVHETLRRLGADLGVVYIRAAQGIRFERLVRLGKCRNYSEFLMHEANELGIGLDRVIQTAAYQVESSPTTSPPQLVDEILKLLENTKAY